MEVGCVDGDGEREREMKYNINGNSIIMVKDFRTVLVWCNKDFVPLSRTLLYG